MKYLVSHQGQQSGPFTLQEVVSKVRSKELELFDYIFDEAKQDWVLLMEHGDVAGQLKSTKPSAPPKLVNTEVAPKVEAVTEAAPATKSAHSVGEWFVLKGEHKFGPFSYIDVVKMLQDKVVFPFDFVWHSGLADWKRLAETAEFSPDQIKTLFEKGGKVKDAFQSRRHKRSQFKGRVIIHDNLKLWKGEGFEISKGGVGVMMKNALIVPGQQLNVHFSSHEEWPAFNAVCEVVSKKFVSDNSPVEYGLKFLSLSNEAQEQFNKKVSK